MITDTDSECSQRCETRVALHLIAETAEYYADKYKYDAFIRSIHQKYAQAIRDVIAADGGDPHE